MAFPSPGDLLDPGIAPQSPALQEDSLLSEPPRKPRERGQWAKWQEIIHLVNNRDLLADKEKQEPPLTGNHTFGGDGGPKGRERKGEKAGLSRC